MDPATRAEVRAQAAGTSSSASCVAGERRARLLSATADSQGRFPAARPRPLPSPGLIQSRTDWIRPPLWPVWPVERVERVERSSGRAVGGGAPNALGAAPSKSPGRSAARSANSHGPRPAGALLPGRRQSRRRAHCVGAHLSAAFRTTGFHLHLAKSVALFAGRPDNCSLCAVCHIIRRPSGQPGVIGGKN